MSIRTIKNIKYEDDLPTNFKDYFHGLRQPRYMNNGTSGGGSVIPDATRGSIIYIISATQEWVHTIYTYSPNRKIQAMRIVVCTGLLLTLCALMCMMRMHRLPGGAHHLMGGDLPGGNSLLDPRRDMHHRIPPVYNPETDRQYPFRRYLQDVGLWSLMTDLPQYQQCATLISRLQGQAREVAALIPTIDIAVGVTLEDGSHVDPVSNLLTHLSQRFSAFPGEERNEAMMKVWTFTRHPHESIDSLLSRFEELRYRAAREGHYMMSIEGWSWTLMKNCPLSQAQTLHVLEPFSYQVPHTEAQFQNLIGNTQES